ncbi:hypothetical protein JOQ06_023480 [Pogonophryne albipinna]|uniref:Uncharacterized protein n=1 Tax=Pogonophryne albipinna TaxID=1090488 RepID=A0AAD6BKC4_9TELE|nr:hypothetical protein JOQ06_023480 [Pogonophryne albipinna]
MKRIFRSWIRVQIGQAPKKLLNKRLIGPVPHVVLVITLSIQIKAEFGRITTISLEQCFMYKLDHYTPKRIALMKAKGGVLGTKLRPFLEKLSQEDSRSDATEHVLKILVVYGANEEDPVDAALLLEGREMMPGCGSTAEACTILMGLIYALNLAYPPTLR